MRLFGRNNKKPAHEHNWHYETECYRICKGCGVFERWVSGFPGEGFFMDVTASGFQTWKDEAEDNKNLMKEQHKRQKASQKAHEEYMKKLQSVVTEKKIQSDQK